MLKALNNVCFGQYCVRAVLARFDRKRDNVVRKDEGVGGKGAVRKDEGVGGKLVVVREDGSGEEKVRKKKLEGEKSEVGSKGRCEEVTTKGGGKNEGEEEGVKVGSVLVKVGGTGKMGSEGDGGSKVNVEGKMGRKASTVKQSTSSRLVRKYTSCEEDLKWASRGLIGTVIDGASIPLIQGKVEDAGFKDIDIIPLGVDKVFVHSMSGVDVSLIVKEAKQFFDMIFSNMVGWKQEVFPFQRGAWIRLYGVPLHAWNENLFKLCVLDCRRYLRADNCSVNKERFDYARVLVATSSLDVVNMSEQIFVDGTMVDVKIIEEWGFNLGDDVCLYDEDDKSTSDSQDNANAHEGLGISKNVEILANKIIQDLVDKDDSVSNDADGTRKEKVETTNSIEVYENISHSVGSPDSPASAILSNEVYESTTATSIKEGYVLVKGNEAASASDM